MHPRYPVKAEHVAEARAAIQSNTDSLRKCEQWLADNAKAAFALGLTHGRTTGKPWTARDVMYVCLNAPRDYDWRRIHSKKVRQVYGAGFDVGAAHKRLGA